MQDYEHSVRTKRHQYRYLFTAKHHGADKSAAQWLPDLSPDDEFAVFDAADEMDFSNGAGNLYGALSEVEESLRILGSLGEQVAKYPCPTEGSPWHGYPLEWLGDQKRRPPKQIFDKMVDSGLITQPMRRRLMKGDHV